MADSSFDIPAICSFETLEDLINYLTDLGLNDDQQQSYIDKWNSECSGEDEDIPVDDDDDDGGNGGNGDDGGDEVIITTTGATDASLTSNTSTVVSSSKGVTVLRSGTAGTGSPASSCGLNINGDCDSITVTPDLGLSNVVINGTNYGCNPGPQTFTNTNSLNISAVCGDLGLVETLNACGESIPNGTPIFAFYDVTSTCWGDIKIIVQTLEEWKYNAGQPNGAPANWGGEIYHIPVHGEKWLKCAEYPWKGELEWNNSFGTVASLSLMNGPNSHLNGDNIGYQTNQVINLPDGTSPEMYSTIIMDPTTGQTEGFLPKLPPGANYTDREGAKFPGGLTEAITLCFFDEATHAGANIQGGGSYHNNPIYFNNSATFPNTVPMGTIPADDYGYSTNSGGNGTFTPTARWVEHYNSWINPSNGVYHEYSFFKGFLFPILPGHQTGDVVGADGGCLDDPYDLQFNVAPGTGNVSEQKVYFALHALAQIHTGVNNDGRWDVGPNGDGPASLFENPVINSFGGSLKAIQAQNPYFALGFGGLDQYGWNINTTLGTPGSPSIGGMFQATSSTSVSPFVTSLNDILEGGYSCEDADCVDIEVLDADTGSLLQNSLVTFNSTDYYTDSSGSISLFNVGSGLHLVQGCFNFTTSGSCSLYELTIHKKIFSFVAGCMDPTSCQNYNPNADYNCPDLCCQLDCNDDCCGTAYIDDCGICVEGNTGLVSNYAMDNCKNCFGDNSECTACLDVFSANYLYNCNGDYVPDALFDDGCCEETNPNCILATLTRKVLDNCNPTVCIDDGCNSRLFDKDDWYLDKLLKISTFFKALEVFQNTDSDCTIDMSALRRVIKMLKTLTINMECRNCNNC